MSEYRETRTVVEDVPIKRARPVVETQYDSVVRESRGMSGGAIAALVLAAIAAAVVITMLILNSQQRDSEDQLAQERARTAAAQQQQPQQPSQPSPQQPVIVMPQSQPAPAPVVVPVPAPSQAPSATAPTSTEVEVDITSKLLDDQDLRSQSIDVKVNGGTAVLSGRVPNEELKSRAETIARTVKGVRSVTNNITVQSSE
ncbi:MAG: BON domain-containing protein [Acidobacteriota bacterium]